MSVFGTNADSMFRYFVCPNDKFVLNSLDETDRDGIVYRILKAENYQRILFVENDGSDYKIFAYDTLSELSFKHPDEFEKIDISNSNSIKAFYEKAQGKQTKNTNGPAGLNLGKKNDDKTNAKIDSAPEYGRRVVAGFSRAEDFLAIFIKLLDALKHDEVQTAIIMQMDLLARVNSPKVKDFMDKARSTHTGKNILLYVAEKKELLSNIVKRDEIHYLHPMLLEFFESSRCDNGSADVIEELQQRNIIVVADKIGSDEIANCILRQKIIKNDKRFENIPVSKVYSLAELLAEDLLNINEKKNFKHIPEKVDNYISFLSGCLDEDSFIKMLEEKCKELYPREIALVRDNNVLHLERITLKDNHFSVMSEREKNKSYLNAMAELNSMIGLHPVKDELNSIMGQIKYSSDDADKEPGHYVFAGNPGTGKTVVARLMGKIFKAIGVLPKGHVVEVSKATLVSGYLGQTQEKVQKLCERALGGVLFVDEAYQLFSGENSEADFGKEAIEVIMKFMEDNRKDLSVIFAGYEDKMNELYKVNEGLESRISQTIRFPDYTSEELLEILKLMMTKKELTADEDFFEEAHKYIVDYKKNKPRDFGNAREIRRILNNLDKNKARRLAIKEQNGENITKEDKMTLTVEDFDIQQSEVDKSAFEKAMIPLNELIGLKSVKERVVSISNYVENQVKRGTGGKVSPGHYVFSGNPGTGKTEVAKLMGEIFKALGVLKRGHVVSVKASDMIGKFQGDVEEKTQKFCEKAIDGVFFLDEAYSLVNCSDGATGYADENCRKIYEKIMTFMEENKNRVSFIFAGYRDEMRKFIAANSGMSSRLSSNNIIDFPDYSVEELYEIFVMMSQKENYIISHGFKDVLLGVFEEKKKNGGSHFGNARMVREILEEIAHNQSNRIAKQTEAGEDINVEDRNTLLPVDINGEITDVGETAFEQAMKELNNMIGLGAVKNKIKSLFNKEKYSLDENSAIKTPGHYIFAGNPGTGKTEVAKLMGKIFRSMGLLKTDKLIRVAPADLIGRFYGDTENITKQKCMDALGGILFVDEAYQLAGQGTLTNGDSTYGTKALETIMDFMTEHKTNLCVIFAGYEDKMERIFATNPGFRSRFRETIFFPDYSTEELIEIFKLKINKKLVFAEGFIEKLKEYFDWKKSLAPDDFGNGRAVEQAVEKIMEYRGDRLEELSKQREPSETDIFTLMPEDIPDIQIDTSIKNKELEHATFRKLSRNSIVNLPLPYEPKAYSNQEISSVIEQSILFVKTDIGCGTAFLISPDGYAITCNHVIEGARQINARLKIRGRIGGADSWHECTVVNTSKDIDIAVIKLTGSNFPYLNIAKPERKISRGEKFILIGYPFGTKTANDPTSYEGSIASSENQRDENGYMLYYINSEAKSGHSGSPIVSLNDGCVIGILQGSITNQSGDLTEEINYMRPIKYLWEEFTE